MADFAPLPFIVGLTGGIGSGKTTVSDLFAARGIPVVDTDVIAHALTGPQGRAMPALVEKFGAVMQQADGRLDRAAMRQRVFADVAARQALESILHPLIFEEALQACASYTGVAGIPYVLLVVPLLVEAGGRYLPYCQRVLVVDCEPESQIKRVMQRNQLTRPAVEAMLAAQAGRQQRLSLATDVLENAGDPAGLVAAVADMDAHFRRLAAACEHTAG